MRLAVCQRELPAERPFSVFVNLSAAQLDDRLLAMVDACLEQTGASELGDGYAAAMTNFRYLAGAVITTDHAVATMKA